MFEPSTKVRLAVASFLVFACSGFHGARSPETQSLQTRSSSLHQAAANGDVEAIRKLVSEGAKVDGPAQCGDTPLVIASGYGQTDAAIALLALGADKNLRGASSPPLLAATACASPTLVRALLERGADPNRCNLAGMTSMHVAALYGRADMVHLLAAHKADANLAAFKGMSPLHLAAISGRLDVILALIETGARLDAEAEHGMTPLIFAAGLGHDQVVAALLEKGADANRQSNDSSAIEVAVEMGHTDIVRRLIEHGATMPYDKESVHDRPINEDANGARLDEWTKKVVTVLRGQRWLIKACYESGQVSKRSAGDRLSCRVAIGASGDVEDVSVVESNLTDRAVLNCARAACGQPKFPPNPESESRVVVYPVQIVPDAVERGPSRPVPSIRNLQCPATCFQTNAKGATRPTSFARQ